MDLDGFKGNEFNLSRISHGELPEASPAQKAIGSAMCFQSLFQESGYSQMLKQKSFVEEMIDFYKEREKNVNIMFGIGDDAI